MPITRETAQKLITIIVECGNGLISTLPTLEQELTPDELKRMKREIGRVIGCMDDSISAKVAAEYPDLAPEVIPIAHKL